MIFFIGAAASLAAPAANLPTTLLAAGAANASTWTSISGDPTLTEWCNTNCAAGFCPEAKCVEDGVADGAAVLPYQCGLVHLFYFINKSSSEPRSP